MGKAKKVKPFVVAALKEKSGAYLIVGIPGHHSGTPTKPNKLGEAFTKAARFTGARVTAHSFDSSVVELHRNDVAPFFEYLRHGLTM